MRRHTPWRAMKSYAIPRNAVGMPWYAMGGNIAMPRKTQIVLNPTKYDYRVLIDRAGATLSMKLPLGKYTAVAEAAADGAWMLLGKSNALSRILRRELLAAPQGAGRGDIDGDGGTDCGKEDNKEGRKEGGEGGEDGDITGSGLEEDSRSGSDSGDGEGADNEGERNDDEEARKDSGESWWGRS